MPRVISNDPIRNILDFASQEGQARDWRAKFLQELDQQRWMAGLNQANKRTNEDARQFDANLAFQRNRAADDFALQRDEMNLRYGQPDPAQVKDASTQRMVNLQLQALDEARQKGLVDDQRYVQAKLAILGGDSMPNLDANSQLPQQRFDLSQQRFDFEKQRTQGIEQRRMVMDRIEKLKTAIDLRRRNGDTRSPEYQQLSEELLGLYDQLGQGSQTAHPAPIAPATQPGVPPTAGVVSSQPTAGGGKPVPYGLLLQYMRELGRDRNRIRARLEAEGYDPNNIVQ